MSGVGLSGTVCDDRFRNHMFALLRVIVRSKSAPDIWLMSVVGPSRTVRGDRFRNHMFALLLGIVRSKSVPDKLNNTSRQPIKNCLRRPLSNPHVCFATCNCPLGGVPDILLMAVASPSGTVCDDSFLISHVWCGTCDCPLERGSGQLN